MEINKLLNNISKTASQKNGLSLTPCVMRCVQLLSEGGDDRMTLQMDKGMINKYFCSTLPRDDIVRRGSCTCSYITTAQFYIAHDLLSKLYEDNNLNVNLLNSANDDIRARLRNFFNLGINNQHAIITCPSGTDAEYLPLCVALLRRNKASKLLNSNGSIEISSSKDDVQILSCVVAAGEVGSGTNLAAGGKHFSNLSPRGTTQISGANIRGLQIPVHVLNFKPRSIDGSTNFMQDDIFASIRETLTKNAYCTAILHIVGSSKTGLVYPSIPAVIELQKELGDRLVVVVDLCQFRCQPQKIREFVDLGFVCLVTGSKFFAGPPFSGAVVLPEVMALEIEEYLCSYHNNSNSQQLVESAQSINNNASSPTTSDDIRSSLSNSNSLEIQSLTAANMSTISASDPFPCILPIGLSDYITSSEIPSTMPELKKFLSSSATQPLWTNVGLTLRWTSALDNLERYINLPNDRINQFSSQWVQEVKRLLTLQSPYLEVVETKDSDIGISDGFAENNIVSFIVRTDDGFGSYRKLTSEEYKQLFEDMTKPPAPLTSLGQPVQLGKDLFVLRIALGADIVIKALEHFDTDPIAHAFSFVKIIEEDRLVIEKLINNIKQLGEKEIHKNRMKLEFQQIDRSFFNLGGSPYSPKILSTNDINYNDSITPTISKFSKAVTHLAKKSSLPSVAILYDIDALLASIHSLQHAFQKNNNKSLHCFAIKSCPISYILHIILSSGMGLETASIMEVKQALRCGASPSKIIFDSPCKTKEELEFVLHHGMTLNINSWNELDLVNEIITIMKQKGLKTTSTIGLRINPLVGPGAILALSTATTTSKFGIPLTLDSRPLIIASFQKYDFLTGLMCHVGSQGVPISVMVDGAEKLVQLSKDIEDVCGIHRISMFDIGGGLQVNYDSDVISPTFEEYATALYKRVPELFNSNKMLVTEFGKALIAKTAAVSALVQDVLGTDSSHQPTRTPTTEERKNANDVPITAITHTGADLFLRVAYCGDKFKHRIELLDAGGRVVAEEAKADSSNSTTRDGTRRPVNVAGPLCFSGDILANSAMLPIPRPTDQVLLLDAGANTISLFSRHCSRLAPAVFGFRSIPSSMNQFNSTSIITSGSSTDDKEEIVITCLKAVESEQSLLEFWG